MKRSFNLATYHLPATAFPLATFHHSSTISELHRLTSPVITFPGSPVMPVAFRREGGGGNKGSNKVSSIFIPATIVQKRTEFAFDSEFFHLLTSNSCSIRVTSLRILDVFRGLLETANYLAHVDYNEENCEARVSLFTVRFIFGKVKFGNIS